MTTVSFHMKFFSNQNVSLATDETKNVQESEFFDAFGGHSGMLNALKFKNMHRSAHSDLKIASGRFSLSFTALLIFLTIINMQPTTSCAEIIPSDRRIDWTPGVSVGVIGGIRNRPVAVNAVTDFGADPTGKTNSKQAITEALSATPSGSACFLPAGTYLISGIISLNGRNNRTLRGAGIGKTILKFNSDAGNGSFNMSGDWPNPSPTINVLSGFTKGSSNIVVDSTTNLAVGRLITVSEINPNWVHMDPKLYGAGPSDAGHGSDRLLNSTHMVTSIEGSSVTFWPPLPIDLTNSPAVTPWKLILKGFALEDLTFDQSESSATAPVYFSQTYGCWLKNVEVKNSSHRQMWWKKAVNCEVRDSYFHDTVGTGPNHEGIDLVQNCCFNLIENNICIGAGKPAIILGDWGGGCSGNVIAYNYIQASTNNTGALETSISANHGPHNLMNLIEGNVCQSVKSDGYYGSTSHLTVFRNVVTANYSPGQFDWPLAVQLCKWSYYCSFIGNILGTPGLDQQYTITNSAYSNKAYVIWQLGYPNTGNSGYSQIYTGTPEDPGDNDVSAFDSAVSQTLLRYKNWDYVNNSVISDSTNADASIPHSLFRSVAPNWWGTNRWPAIGPDQSPMVSEIPAQSRYQVMSQTGDNVSPPQNLKIKAAAVQ